MWRLALPLALAAPLAAGAADVPRAEVFAGYSHARHQGQETDGFLGGVDLNLGGSLGIELSVARHYKTQLGDHLAWTEVLAGPRYAWHGRSLSPFVSVQAGIERRSEGAEIFDVTIRLTETKLAGAATAGLDVSAGAHWGVRVQAAFVVHGAYPEERVADAPDAGLKGDPQAALAVVYRFGKR